MIEVESTKKQRMAELDKLVELTWEAIYAVKDELPGKDIRITIDEDSISYWLDGDCFTERKSYYLPD